MNRIDYSSSVIWIPYKKFYLPARQVKNAVHQPNHKIQYPRAIAWTLLCLLSLHTVFECPVNNTVTWKYEANLPDEINKTPVQVTG